MTRKHFAFATLLVLAALALPGSAQDKPKADTKPPAATLKIQVVIAEQEGEKKVASLPYAFFVRATDTNSVPAWTKLRMGSRVPVATGSFQGGPGVETSNGVASISPLVNTQFQYIDVGTHIDARAFVADDKQFELTLNLERSWVEGDLALPGEKQSSQSTTTNTGQFREPIIRQFKTELVLPIHDGQTIQTTQATDPLSGRVLTLTVTMNLVK